MEKVCVVQIFNSPFPIVKDKQPGLFYHGFTEFQVCHMVIKGKKLKE